MKDDLLEDLVRVAHNGGDIKEFKAGKYVNIWTNVFNYRLVKSIPEKVATLSQNSRRSQKLMERYKLNKEVIDRRAKDAYHMKRLAVDQARGMTNPGVQSRSKKRKSKHSGKDTSEAEMEEVLVYFANSLSND